MAKTKFQSGSAETVWRSSIKEHPLNPRKISEAAKKKLIKSIKEVGVLDMPIVNKSTGRIVGGHQRIHAMDYLGKYQIDSEGQTKNDYELVVSLVELTEEQEAAALVRLNNTSMQGQFDGELLIELGEQYGVTSDSFMMDALDFSYYTGQDVKLDEFSGDAEATETQHKLQEVKAARSEMNAKQAIHNNGDWYVTVVCRDADEKHKLLKSLNLPKGESFISPAEIFALVEKHTSA